jgi:4-hydroxyphenylpyruvate dioxygenase
MERLRATGFDGPFSLEIFNDQFRASDPFRHACDAYRSLVYIAQETEPSSKVITKSRGLPKVTQPTGINFIEFAVDESEHQKLTSFL